MVAVAMAEGRGDRKRGPSSRTTTEARAVSRGQRRRAGTIVVVVGGRPRGSATFHPELLSLLLVAMSLLLLPARALGYGEREFLAAYNDPNVTHHDVKGDVYLSASLPALTRDLTLVGVRGRGGKLPVIDGQSRYTGVNVSSRVLRRVRVTLRKLEFRNFITNNVLGGAAVYVEGYIRVEIDKCVFRGNEATVGHGGAMTVDTDSFYQITNSRFEANRAKGVGGAIMGYSDTSGQITSTTFKDNYSNQRGGAITVRPGSLRIDRCQFHGNKEDGGEGGGAVSCSEGTCTVSMSDFKNNVAKGKGGALRFYVGDDGGGDVCRGNTFSGNEAIGDARSNNIYVEAVDVSYPAVEFCLPQAPPQTLINATQGAVVFESCKDC